MRILVLDIETAPALAYVWSLGKQYVGAHQIAQPKRMLCWNAKWVGESKSYFEAAWRPEDQDTMLDTLWHLLDEADAVVHYNGTSFDIPHVNGELLLAGYGPYSPVKQIDLWRTVRSQFKFMSNKLDEVTKTLGLGEKVSHEGLPLWIACINGDTKAKARMTKYNKQDVALTERLYETILPWIRTHPNAAIGVPGEACTRCGVVGALKKRGFHRTSAGLFQTYRCGECEGYSRSPRSEAGAELRPV